MTLIARISKAVRVGGENLVSNIAMVGTTSIAANFSVDAAKTGSLTTRGSGTAGTLTMTADHRILTGDVVDIFWASGRRQAVTVGTVSTNSVPFTGGTGDNLPVLTTAVTAMRLVDSNGNVIDGNYADFLAHSQAQMLTFSTPKRGIFRLFGVSSVVAGDPLALVSSEILLGPGGVFEWHNNNGESTPLTGVSVYVMFTHGETSAVIVSAGALLAE